MNSRVRNSSSSKRGTALIATVILIVGLGIISLSLLQAVGSSNKEDRQVREEIGSRYVAEAGLSEAYYDLMVGGDGQLGAAEDRATYGGGEFWVERVNHPNGTISLISTAVDGRAASRVEMVLTTNPDSMWSYGAFGDDGVSMSSNAHVDSYNSSLGTYDDQAVNTEGNQVWASENGNVGSNHDVNLDQNSYVHGDAIPGPDGTTTILGKAQVSGSTTSAASEIELPPIDLPVIASSGPLEVPGQGTQQYGPGEFAFDQSLLNAGSTLNIIGPATVVFSSLELGQNSMLEVDTTNGAVEIFVVDDFVMGSNTTFAPMDRNPTRVKEVTAEGEVIFEAALALNLLSDNVVNPDANVDLDEVDFESNAEFYGTLYAPYAIVEINSNFQLFGAMVAREILLDSNSKIHFDESLLDIGSDDEANAFDPLGLQELTVNYQEIPK